MLRGGGRVVERCPIFVEQLICLFVLLVFNFALLLSCSGESSKNNYYNKVIACSPISMVTCHQFKFAQVTTV